jgi:large conductance mechanosensitive channel
MPLVSYVVPNGEWQTWQLGRLKVGSVLGATIDFLIISLVVFLVLVKGLGRFLKKEPAPEPPPNKVCPRCCETVPLAASRCKFCTSDLEA